MSMFKYDCDELTTDSALAILLDMESASGVGTCLFLIKYIFGENIRCLPKEEAFKVAKGLCCNFLIRVTELDDLRNVLDIKKYSPVVRNLVIHTLCGPIVGEYMSKSFDGDKYIGEEIKYVIYDEKQKLFDYRTKDNKSLITVLQ